jgi:catechol 2,3-dioxygenase-like lactoylglutathione lyase family enzyme
MEEGIMAITLNHTIVPAQDKQASAQFFAHIFGLQVKAGEGRFAQVQVNDTLTIDYDQLRPVVESLHYAFHVSDAEFDDIYGRVKAAGIAYGSPLRPREHADQQRTPRRPRLLLRGHRRSPAGGHDRLVLVTGRHAGGVDERGHPTTRRSACRCCCRAGRIQAHALACHNVPYRNTWAKTG